MIFIVDRFFVPEHAVVTAISGDYSPFLVLLSYVVASIAAYVSLGIAESLIHTKNTILRYLGACTLGVGIWSMHFTGMLAFKIDIAHEYDLSLTAFSLAIAIIFSYVVYTIIQSENIGRLRLIFSAILLGIGISTMHYAGMESMIMHGKLYYSPVLFALSILVAITASALALRVFYSLARYKGNKKLLLKAGAALMLGAGVCGMHYTGMEASIFIPMEGYKHDPNQNHLGLALITAGATSFILIASFLYYVNSTNFSNSVISNTNKMQLYWPVMLVFITGILISGLLYRAVEKTLTAEYRVEFQTLANAFASEMQQVFVQKTSVLNAIQAFYSASNQVEREEFNMFTTGVLYDIIGVDAISYAPLINIKDEKAFLYKVRKTLPEYTIKPAPGSNQGNPTNRNYMLPVLYNAIAPNEDVYLGRDYASNSDFLETIKAAKKYNTVMAHYIEPYSDLSSSSASPDMLVFLPIYKKNALPSDDWVDNSLGVVILDLNTPSLIKEISEQSKFESLDIQLQYSEKPNSKTFFQTTDMPADHLFFFNKEIHFAGRPWNIVFHSKPGYFDHQNWLKSTTLIVGIILTSIISFYLKTILRQKHSNVLALDEKEKIFLQMQRHNRQLKEAKETSQMINRLLRIEKTRTTAIVENVMQAIIVVREDMNIESFNFHAERIFGYLSKEITGSNISAILPDDGEGNISNHIKPYLDKIKTSSLSNEIEVPGRNKNGEFFPMSMSVTEIAVDDENMYIILARDISEQKRREDDLLQAKHKAEAASKSKGDFLANMSHEIRTPMNSILGMAALLLETPLNAEQEKWARVITKSGENLMYIINDILDFSKIEAGKLKIEHINFNLFTMLEEVTEILQFHTTDKKLELLTTIADDVPEFVYGAPGRIQQILFNIVGNAIKFTNDGQVLIHVRSIPIEKGKTRIFFEVKDTGIGIPGDKIHHIFTKFSQAEESTTRVYGGTGLGLAISLSLAEMMGGSMYVSSEIGVGTTFCINVVLTPVEESMVDNTHSKTIEGKRLKQYTTARVLIVEDMPMNLMLLEAVLKKHGIIAHTASNGKEALDIIQSGEKYDLIFMDCQMPEMDGFEATKMIRSYEKVNHITPVTIVALTADAMTGDREKCLGVGMNDYLNKPVSAEEIAATLNQWLAK